jgi:ferredoxin
MKKGDPDALYRGLRERVDRQPKPVEPVYYELADRIMPGDKDLLPRILAKMADPEQIRIVAALPDPDAQPASGKSLAISEQFAGHLGMEKGRVEQHIQELFEKGLLFPTKKGPAMARTFIQLHDAALGNPKFDTVLGQDYFDLWGCMEGIMRQPQPEDIHPGKSEFRVVPRWKAIADVPGVEDFDDLRTILKAHELIVLLSCGCKRAHNTDRWCGVPEESCITTGRAAEYNMERGAGRRITYEEALEVLDKYDKHPVVNITVNQRALGQLICNCHYCCCLGIRGAEKSRFVAVMNPEKCKACKVCVERCQFGAISMKAYPGLEGERAYVDEEICRGCGSCVVGCKFAAKTMKVARPPEHIPETYSIY